MTELEREIAYCETAAFGAANIAALLNGIAMNVELGQGVKADPEIAAYISAYADPYVAAAQQWQHRAHILASGGMT